MAARTGRRKQSPIRPIGTRPATVKTPQTFLKTPRTTINAQGTGPRATSLPDTAMKKPTTTSAKAAPPRKPPVKKTSRAKKPSRY